MNEKNNISRLRKLANLAGKKFTKLGKASKLLLKIATFVFFAFLLAALCLSILFMAGTSNIGVSIKLIEWIVLYSFRFWVMMVFGALILDILIKR